LLDNPKHSSEAQTRGGRHYLLFEERFESMRLHFSVHSNAGVVYRILA
jgi:hypothetical protein